MRRRIPILFCRFLRAYIHVSEPLDSYPQGHRAERKHIQRLFFCDLLTRVKEAKGDRKGKGKAPAHQNSNQVRIYSSFVLFY
jgi:hypothetical protein